MWDEAEEEVLESVFENSEFELVSQLEYLGSQSESV